MSVSARLIEFCTVLKQKIDQLQISLEGVARSGVSKIEPYGVRSNIPLETRGLVLAPNGQANDLVFLGVFTKFFERGTLLEGELELYTVHGNSMRFNENGTITTNGTLIVNGDLLVSGNVSDANGSMAEMRSQYNGHTHGGGPTPSPAMS
jgi:phage gp45-like